jgi:hypothetical protein
MNNIILSISLLVSFLAGFLVAIKSVQLGLKWQIQTADKKEPELRGPIAPIVEAMQENKTAEANKERELFIKEYTPFQ